jgi:hypothetical protein
MRTAILGILLAVGAPAAQAADAGAEAARSYRIETDGTTRRLDAGGAGKLVLAIVPAEGTHVHPAAPLKIALSATPGLTLSRRELGHADAIDPKADGPRFEVPFTATAAGAQEARAQVGFYICSETWCVKQSRDVRVSVDVK